VVGVVPRYPKELTGTAVVGNDAGDGADDGPTVVVGELKQVEVERGALPAVKPPCGQDLGPSTLLHP
jgi:hypothetical protein